MSEDNSERTGRGPKPIERTVRRLFAEQVGCARPGCNRLLIDDLDGKQVQTCEIAHICAYATLGPRHDPTITPDGTREFANLLLLCKDCHDLVDEYVDDYPPALLAGWKTGQKNLALENGGEYLSDDQVLTALAALEDKAQASPHVAQIARQLETIRALVRSLEADITNVLRARQAEIDELNRTSWIYDSETGEKLTVQLSRNSELQYREQAQSRSAASLPALATAGTELRAEIAAASAVTDRVPVGYIEWTSNELDELVARCGELRLGDNPCSALTLAVDSVVDLIKGENARAEPPVPEEPLPPDESEMAIALIQDLADRTQPYLRASNRPFDESDANQILEILPLAIDLGSQHNFSVRTFMYRLVAMLKTATEEQILDVTASIEEMPHGVIAEFIQIATVEDIGFSLDETAATELRARLVDQLEANVQDIGYWHSNKRLMSQVIRHHAIYVDPESTAALILPMLDEHQDLCFEVLTWFAWEDNDTGSQTFVTGMGPPLPQFIPADPIITAVQSRYPDLCGLDEFKARAEPDPERRLAATFLVAHGL